jgi:hypothetical protein
VESLPAGLSLLAPLVPLVCPPAETLRDDFRHYMPELLPKFVALLNEAERTNDFSLVSCCLAGWCRQAVHGKAVCFFFANSGLLLFKPKPTTGCLSVPLPGMC